jgi:G6PDH family F420-dependent oxidoreductase
MEIGYKLSSEEHRPEALVQQARRAEEVGFAFAATSDHFHPWVDQQGQSPFVWTVLGAAAQATRSLTIGTAVTCPTMRIHPAIIAQAAATTAALMPGRFFLGLGTGEKLNEHILGRHWPPFDVRAEMLEEAVQVIRDLWRGEMYSHRGRHFTVENARLYTLPETPPAIYIAASGPEAGKLAGRIGDGLIATAPDKKLVETFASAGGRDKPRLAELAVCWAHDAAEAKQTAHRWWPIAGIEGAVQFELPLPEHFQQASAIVRPEDVAESVALGPDVRPYVESVQQYADAGFDHVWFHQIGPDQEGFFTFYERDLAPALKQAGLLGRREPVTAHP